jgi:hypothetical protein
MKEGKKMRSENEILEEIEILKKKEKEVIEKMRKGLEDRGGELELVDGIISLMVLSSILSFTTWAFGKSELRFSTLLEIEDVSKKGIESGAPLDGVLEFAMKKIKELGGGGEQKN